MQNEQTTHQIHDKFFKSVFQVKETVEDFLIYLMPPELALKISVARLTSDNTNYVSEHFTASYSDVVFRSVWMEEAKNIPIALLFEHKSAPEPEILEQLLTYRQAIRSKDVQNKKRPSVVFFIVIYQGKKPWNKKSKKKFPSEFERFKPTFDYIFVSLEERADAFLLELSQRSLLGAAMLAMKKADNRAFLKQHFASFFSVFENRPELREIFNNFVIYLQERSLLNPKEWKELMHKHLSSNMKTQVKAVYETTAQILRREGKAEGKAEGEVETLRKNIQRLLLKKALSEVAISDILEVPLSLVLSIKDDLIKNGQLIE